MDTLRRGTVALASLLALAGCVSTDIASEVARSEVRVVPDDPVDPRHVRFEVPTAILLGQPGPDRVPTTFKARIATRDLAARELAARGYCPYGFSGPEGVFFAEGDRGRSAFVVHCQG